MTKSKPARPTDERSSCCTEEKIGSYRKGLLDSFGVSAEDVDYADLYGNDIQERRPPFFAFAKVVT